MTPDLLAPIIARWLHIIAAITTVGGAIFIRVVLLPAVSTVLDDETHEKLSTAMWRRWQLLVHICIGALILSGFYNFVTLSVPYHDGQAIYHALFGIKFLLAVVVFLLAILLTSRKKYSERIRANRKFWSSILVVCALAVVLISGVLKNLPNTSMPEATVEATTTEG